MIYRINFHPHASQLTKNAYNFIGADFGNGTFYIVMSNNLFS